MSLGEHQELNQNKQFLMIDYEILKINQIIHNGNKYKFTDSSKNLYCYLKNWPKAFPSHNRIADVFGISRDAAKDRIDVLVGMGLVNKIERIGSSNLYTVKDITPEMTTGRSRVIIMLDLMELLEYKFPVHASDIEYVAEMVLSVEEATPGKMFKPV